MHAKHGPVWADEPRPALVLQTFAINFGLPILYLTVPHAARPWLYRARLLVAGAVAVLNVAMARHTAPTNLAVAYAVGLAASWGTIWVFAALVFLRPQFDAERVERRLRPPRPSSSSSSPVSARRITSGIMVAPSLVDLASSPTTYSTALASSPTAMSVSNGHTFNSHALNGHAAANGTSPVLKSRRRKSVRFVVPPDDDVACSLVEHEYFWQAFPADAPFGTRLGWAFDYYMAWRGTGWSWAISCVPRFDHPAEPLSEELVKLDSIPLVSHAGYRRHAKNDQFVWDRLCNIAIAYLILDFCAVFMTKDRYFDTGLHDSPPPLYLSAIFPALPPSVLYIYRMTLGFVGMLSALTAVLSADQLSRRGLARAFAGGVSSDLWQYSDNFGSFSQLLDHGLAGFWGRYWHQTFRVGYTAPSKWLIRRGWLPARRSAVTGLVASACAFLLSGTMHASGSATMQRHTRPWMAFAFFALAWVGVVLQFVLCELLRRPIAASPPAARRAGNMLFVLAWMYATCWAFEDDLSRSGLWGFEPIPYSPLRAMGFGESGDEAFRWGGCSFVAWHAGKRWWDSGPAVL
ncbi:hypothetical protein RB595_000826 [Gaeumannomyces hyphopodioides]